MHTLCKIHYEVSPFHHFRSNYGPHTSTVHPTLEQKCCYLFGKKWIRFTYKLFLFISWEPVHLLFVCLHLLFVILKVSHHEPKKAAVMAGIRFTCSLQFVHLVWIGDASQTEKFSLVLPGFVLEVINSFHEESDTEQSAVTVFKQQT